MLEEENMSKTAKKLLQDAWNSGRLFFTRTSPSRWTTKVEGKSFFMCDWVYLRAYLVFGNYGLDSFCQIWHKRTIFKFYGRIPDSSILGFCLWIRATRIGVSTNGILLQNLPMYVHPFGKDDFGIYISHILLLSDPLYTLRSKCCWVLLILCTFHAVAVSCC